MGQFLENVVLGHMTDLKLICYSITIYGLKNSALV